MISLLLVKIKLVRFDQELSLLSCPIRSTGVSKVDRVKVHSYTAAFCSCGMRFAVAENFFVWQIR